MGVHLTYFCDLLTYFGQTNDPVSAPKHVIYQTEQLKQITMGVHLTYFSDLLTYLGQINDPLSAPRHVIYQTEENHHVSLFDLLDILWSHVSLSIRVPELCFVDHITMPHGLLFPY